MDWSQVFVPVVVAVIAGAGGVFAGVNGAQTNKLESWDKLVARLEARIEVLEEKVTDLESMLDAKNLRINQLEDELHAAEERIRRLEHWVRAQGANPDDIVGQPI